MINKITCEYHILVYSCGNGNKAVNLQCEKDVIDNIIYPDWFFFYPAC